MTPEMRARVSEIRNKVQVLLEAMEYEKLLKNVEELTAETQKEEVWSKPEILQQVNRKKKQAELIVVPLTELNELIAEIDTIVELSAEDPSLEEELEENLEKVNTLYLQAEFNRMLSGPSDPGNAIVSINAGAGGTESQDWAEMLLRMIIRYCERKGFQAEITDILSGEEAGIKSATFIASGEYAYGFLSAEAGVHRLVRISPYDANRRRHTSFASMSITPEVDDSIDIEVNESDLRVDTYRSSGKGGQHVNTTDSAVRLTHLPTGVVVACQAERSQHKNKSKALKILKSKLYELELQKQVDQHNAHEATKKEISFGSQIRSYVLHPYQMIKDHRTNYETSNVNDVLDGGLDEFIRRYKLEYGQS